MSKTAEIRQQAHDLLPKYASILSPYGIECTISPKYREADVSPCSHSNGDLLASLESQADRRKEKTHYFIERIDTNCLFYP